MSEHCPLKDSSTCQHPARKGECSVCHFDFETLDPDEGMFRLRRVNAEAIFKKHLVSVEQKQKKKVSADEARVAKREAELEQAKREATAAKKRAVRAALRKKTTAGQQHNTHQSESKIGRIFRHELKRADGSSLGPGPDMIEIPAGTYLRGSPDTEYGRLECEGPQMKVNISPFQMGRTPVTVGQWKQFVADTKRGFWGALVNGGVTKAHQPEVWWVQTDEHPVRNINWYDANAYIAWLNSKVNIDEGAYRLPSETEWEYAARAGTVTPFYYGGTIDTDQANFNGTDNHYPGTLSGHYKECTTPVKAFVPNNFGLYDMHGTVSEWCGDVWHDSYQGSPTDGQAWTDGGDQNHHILRGGSWHHSATNVRSASREHYASENRINIFGFRLARTIAKEKPTNSVLDPMAAWPFPTASKP